MTYEETLDFLFKQLPVYQIEGGRAYKPGLERTREILAACGRPDRELIALHVAGTNGKGSTSYLLASVLRAAGLRVGLFTSPHIVTYRERIRINGEMIPEEYITRFVEQFLRDLGDHLQPSFFELTTALAFRYFVDEKVDIAVVEVGMGGRLDSTNVLSPLVSVITNVSMDHMQFLGNTLGEIAHEKAGIIKPHTPVVLGRSIDEPVLEVVRTKAAEEQAPLTLADRSDEILSHEEIEGAGYRVETKSFGTIDLPLMGSYQLQNLGTVLETIKLIRDRYGITPEMVREGVARVADFGLSGRLQMIRQRPRAGTAAEGDAPHLHPGSCGACDERCDLCRARAVARHRAGAGDRGCAGGIPCSDRLLPGTLCPDALRRRQLLRPLRPPLRYRRDRPVRFIGQACDRTPLRAPLSGDRWGDRP